MLKITNIWTMGEMLVEIMRPKPNMPFNESGEFLGPFPSGAPAIFADTVAKLGHPAGIIGSIGADGFGENILKKLKQDGVNCENVLVIPGKPTAVAFVTYSNDGSRNYIFYIDGTSATKKMAIPKELIPKADFFHIMGCSLTVSDEFRKNIISNTTAFWEKGTQITFDPNIRKELLQNRKIGEIIKPIIEHCSIIFPGIEELNIITGKNSIEAGVNELFKNDLMKLVILKKGKKGCTIFLKEEKIDIPAFSIEEIDPTGAGDCFDAGFLCGLAEGKSLYECGRIASAAGALNTAMFGPMEGKMNKSLIKKMLNQNE